MMTYAFSDFSEWYKILKNCANNFCLLGTKNRRKMSTKPSEQPERKGEEEGEGWIIESLKWPKTQEKGEKEGEKIAGGKRNWGDLEAPSEYSDSDDDVPWVKPLLGACHGRSTCFCSLCLIVDWQKLWRQTRRHNHLLNRHVNRHGQEIRKLKEKIKKLEATNATLKSLTTN